MPQATPKARKNDGKFKWRRSLNYSEKIASWSYLSGCTVRERSECWQEANIIAKGYGGRFYPPRTDRGERAAVDLPLRKPKEDSGKLRYPLSQV